MSTAPCLLLPVSRRQVPVSVLWFSKFRSLVRCTWTSAVGAGDQCGHTIIRGVAASRFLGRQELVAYKVLVLTLGSMINIPMVWSM